MILTDELCDKLCTAALEKSRELGVDVSFAVCDEHGLPRVYRRFGEALVLSITLVAGGYPLFYQRKIAGGIGVGGGTEEEDCAIAEYVVSVFEKLTK